MVCDLALALQTIAKIYPIAVVLAKKVCYNQHSGSSLVEGYPPGIGHSLGNNAINST